MTRQRVFERGDGESSDEHCQAEQHGTDSAVGGASGDKMADHTDDGGAGVASPGELIGWRDQQNRDTHKHSDGAGAGQLNEGNDAIGHGEDAVVHQTTGNAEREHMRDCKAASAAIRQTAT